MAYQALYRKWRPLTFEDVVGQKHITDTLKTELLTDRVAHAYLFCGTRGTGKTTSAKILSRAINCERLLPNGNPCNECDSCKGILSGTIMDVIEIDAASNNGVDNIRELREEIAYTPANVKFKIYIIDEVHMLSSGAFNALLKTLEEPPAHAIFILATTEPHKIPATIQSRCQRFDFHRISVKNIAGRISEITRKDNILIMQDAVHLVAELGDGSMRDALSILDLCSGITGEITKADIENVAGVVDKNVLYEIATALINRDISSAIVLVDKMICIGKDVGNLLDELLLYCRELLICKIVSSPHDILDKADEDLLACKQLADKTSNESLIHIIRTLADTVAVCKYSTHPRIMLECSLVKICNPELDTKAEAYAVRLKNIEDMITLGKVPHNAVVKLEKPAEISIEKPIEKPIEKQVEVVVEQVAEMEIPLPDEPPMEQFSQEQAPKVAQNDDIDKIFSSLKTQNPALASLLIGVKSRCTEDVLYIVFKDEFIRNTVRDNAMFLDALVTATGYKKIKLVTEFEESNKKVEADPLDEILSLNLEQMTIF